MRLFCFLVIFLLSPPLLHAENIRFALSLTDFFNPILSNEQIKEAKVNMIDSIRIIGVYSKISRNTKLVYVPNCMTGVTCFPFGGEWERRKEVENFIQEHEANILNISKENQQIIFELPKFKSNKFAFDSLIISYKVSPSGIQKNKALQIPLAISKEPNHTNHHRYFKEEKYSGIWIREQSSKQQNTSKVVYNSNEKSNFLIDVRAIFKLEALNQENIPLADAVILNGDDSAIFADEEKIQMTLDGLRLNHVNDFLYSKKDKTMIILSDMPRWNISHGVNKKDLSPLRGAYFEEGNIEALYLNQGITYGPGEDIYNNQETWFGIDGKLMQIVSDPSLVLHNQNICLFQYGIYFYPDGKEVRYFVDPKNEKLYYNKDGRQSSFYVKKILKDKNLSLFDEFEKKNIEKLEKDHFKSRELAACRKRIAEARAILSASRSELESAYNKYKQLIPHEN